MVDRQIIDASPIANEIIIIGRKVEKDVICKLDIEKAYDSINWHSRCRLCIVWVLGLNGLG